LAVTATITCNQTAYRLKEFKTTTTTTIKTVDEATGAYHAYPVIIRRQYDNCFHAVT